MRTCVIFNPVAKGDKARHFRRHLDAFSAPCELRGTTAPNEARHLAARAVEEGFDTVVAAGGDGTLNEVLNGIGDVPDGFDRARLGVLPLGTVNVFARELGLPTRLQRAWQAVLAGRERRIDLGCAEFTADGAPQRRYFAQLAGAGLDTRAIELVNWSLKKKTGPLAYFVAGFKALSKAQSSISVRLSGSESEFVGELVLIGNGRLYGGRYRVFPKADDRDGQLDLCIFPRVTWFTLARTAPGLLLAGKVPESIVRRVKAAAFTLASDTRTPFEVDGEWAGHLPAAFSLQPAKLRVLVP